MSIRFVLCLAVVVLVSGCSEEPPPPPAPTNTPVRPTATPVPQKAGIMPTPYIKMVYDREFMKICDSSAKEVDKTYMPDMISGVVDTTEIENWRQELQVYFEIQQASGDQFVDFASKLLSGYGHTDQNCEEIRFSSSDLPLPYDKRYRWKAVVTETRDIPAVPLSDWHYSDGFTVTMEGQPKTLEETAGQ